jgi:hypothetical protein
MSKNWIQSHSGKQVVPGALTKEMVGNIDEIAHALSLKCRFTGQCPAFYSVAQHCVIGASLLPPAFAGAFLLHKLSKVYLPDIASPLKPLVSVLVPREGVDCVSDPMPWADLERHHTRVILEALGLSSIEPLIYSPEVKRMDLAMLAAEKRDFFPEHPEDWGLAVEPAPCDPIQPQRSIYAAGAFREAFARYFK